MHVASWSVLVAPGLPPSTSQLLSAPVVVPVGVTVTVAPSTASLSYVGPKQVVGSQPGSRGPARFTVNRPTASRPNVTVNGSLPSGTVRLQAWAGAVPLMGAQPVTPVTTYPGGG